MKYSVEEVSKILGVCYDTVCRWIKNGKIQCIECGGRYVITHDNLETFLSSNKKYSGSADCIVRYYVNALYRGDDTLDRLQKELEDLEAAKALIEVSIYKTKKFIAIIQNKNTEAV